MKNSTKTAKMMESIFFGKKLVSVPFAPYDGVYADNETVEKALIEEAKRITKEYDVDYLELRNTNKNEPKLQANNNYINSYYTKINNKQGRYLQWN